MNPGARWDRRIKMSDRIPRCLAGAVCGRDARSPVFFRRHGRTSVRAAFDHDALARPGEFKFDLSRAEVARRQANGQLARAVLSGFAFLSEYPRLESGLRAGYDETGRITKRAVHSLAGFLPAEIIRRARPPQRAKPNGNFPHTCLRRELIIENNGRTETFTVKMILPLEGLARSGIADIYLAGLGLKAEASFREHCRTNGETKSSMIRESLAAGNVVVIVDAPGLGKSEKITWSNGDYYQVFVEKMMPEVNQLCKDDELLHGLQLNFIGHSQGAAVPLMMLAHFGETELLRQLGRERIAITAIALPLRIFPDLDPSLAGLLSLDPFLNRHLENGTRVRTLPYYTLGPLCELLPDWAVRRIADRPLLGRDLTPEIMRNFFGWAGGTISYMMIQGIMYNSLINGYPPYLRGPLPISERVKIVAVHAQGDPWAPPEGFPEVFRGLSLADREHVIMFGLRGAQVADDLPGILRGIVDPSNWAVAVVLDKDCDSGHLAAAMRGPKHSEFMPQILAAARMHLLPV